MGELDTGLRLPSLENLKQLFEVELLPSIGDVDDFMGFPALTSIIERSKVRRGVIGTAILFKDQRRVILQFRNPLKKDNLGALTFDSKT